VRRGDDDPHEVMPIQNAAVPPLAPNPLRFIADSALLVDNLQRRFGNAFARHGAAIIELKRRQHFEALRLAPHRSPRCTAEWNLLVAA
jgi:hypothetical protein